MNPAQPLDAAVIGGGIMGCTTALHLAEGGMSVAVLERRGLCMEASGVNAGTLAIQVKRPALVPYAMRARELWCEAQRWLGMDVGYRVTGGLTLAFTEEEARMLEARTADRAAAGAPISLVDGRKARDIEPGISGLPLMASHCPLDGYASSNLMGLAYRKALGKAGVELHEWNTVRGVERTGSGFLVHAAAGSVATHRIVLAGGVWLTGMAAWLGFGLPIECRVNQVSVCARLPPVLGSVVTIATGRLTIKQSSTGTVLIGGGWQGIGDSEQGGYEVVPANLVGNVRLAALAVPPLGKARIVRTWLGLQDHSADEMPVVGPLPSVPDAFVIGCTNGGFTIGPFMGRLLAQSILGREPEMPLFDPARLLVEPPVPPDGARIHGELTHGTDRRPKHAL